LRGLVPPQEARTDWEETLPYLPRAYITFESAGPRVPSQSVPASGHFPARIRCFAGSLLLAGTSAGDFALPAASYAHLTGSSVRKRFGLPRHAQDGPDRRDG